MNISLLMNPSIPPQKANFQTSSESIFLQGKLENFNLSDIIQLIVMSQKSGSLVLQNPELKEKALLYIANGSLIHAEFDEEQDVVVFEIVIKWDKGDFYFLLDVKSPVKSIEQDLQSLLLNAVSKIDDIQRLANELPDDGAKLVINQHILRVHELTLEEWKVLVLANGRRTIRNIFQMIGNELTVKQLLVRLLKKGSAVFNFT